MPWPYVPCEPEKVPSGVFGLGQELRERTGRLGTVAGGAGSHYVAAGVVAAANPRLNVVDAEMLCIEYVSTVDAAIAVPRENFSALQCAWFPVKIPDPSRRIIFERLKRIVDVDVDEVLQMPGDVPPRLTSHALEALRMSRSRDRILTNLEEMYREAFERAKATEDPSQMAALDFSFRREQLYFEILLDIRDAMERR
jgi:hypothetical protein